MYDTAPVHIYLHLRDNHYSLITSIKFFFKRDYFCDTCMKAYNKFDEHLCNGICRMCKLNECGPSVSVESEQNECEVCWPQFKSLRCFELHLHKKKKSVCDKIRRCRECNKTYLTTNGVHECYTKIYNNCGLRVVFRLRVHARDGHAHS